MDKLKVFPEILAGLSLLPCGFSICVLLYSDATEKFYPYLVIVGVTIIIAAIMNATKIYSDKFKFYNFYYLIVGNICFFISGVLLITIDDTLPSTYLSAVGHGIVYIPAIFARYFEKYSDDFDETWNKCSP